MRPVRRRLRDDHLRPAAVDPLQTYAEACIESLVHNPRLVRRLPTLLRTAGLPDPRLRGHSYVEAPASDGYLLALLDEFFGHIAYLSAIATKPGGE